MNLIGIKELISYNYPKLKFVEKPSINELVIKKDGHDQLLVITQSVHRNQYMVRSNDISVQCHSLTGLFNLIELIKWLNLNQI